MAGAFSIDLGTSQGRILSSYAAEGSYVYELGHAAKIAERINAGDYHEVKQDIVFDTQAKFLRVQVRISQPAVLSAGYSWKLTAYLNGVARAIHTITGGARTLILTDLAIPLALANTAPTSNEIKFRLELTT